jgi:hypothetical protein
VKILYSSMFLILVLISLCTLINVYFDLKKDPSFYNFIFYYTIPQHGYQLVASTPMTKRDTVLNHPFRFGKLMITDNPRRGFFQHACHGDL